MQSRARRHHRVDGVFLLDLEIDQHRTFVGVRGANGGNHVCAVLHTDAADAVRLASATKFGLTSGVAS